MQNKNLSLLPDYEILKKHSLFSVSAIAFSLLILAVSCDLFNKPKDPHFIKKIDAEIAWANAKKLTVHLSFDRNWGTSNPGQGKITPKPMDIRQRYAFDIEFNPDTAYSLAEWRAFSGELPQGWEEDISQLEDEGIKARELEIGKDFVLVSAPEIFSRGGNYSMKINVTGIVTIVPWCKTEPRITRTEPRFMPNMELPRGSVISIYFNAPLDESSVQNAITITSDGKDYSEHYTVGYFDTAGQFVVALAPKSGNLPEAEKEITVTVKSGEGGIANIQGEWMQGDDAVYTWKTQDAAEVSVETWGAVYNDSSGTIDVEWKLTGEIDRVEAFYTVNRGPKIPLAAAGNKAITNAITGVGKIHDANIRQGATVSGVQEYEISIDIYEGNLLEESRSFKIWNIPGMKVNNANPAIEIDSINNEQFTDNNGKTFVLTKDIVIDKHMPIAGFQGNFYGNGNKITINSFNNVDTETEIGLFGTASGDALIRDLVVEYNIPLPIDIVVTAAAGIGGIVGSASGNTRILNCIVQDAGKALAVNAGSGNNGVIRIGGIAGFFEGSGKIENCLAALSVAYNKSGLYKGDVCIGGIAGETGDGTGEKISINNGLNDNILLDNEGKNGLLIHSVTVTANVSANLGDNARYLKIGGAVGKSGQNTIKDIEYIKSLPDNGTVSLYRSYAPSSVSNICGGIVGDASTTNITDCSFSGVIGLIPTDSGGGDSANFSVTIGGLAGLWGDPGIISNNFYKYYTNNSRVSGNISFSSGSASRIGGVFGFIYNSNAVQSVITNCFFEDGDILLSGTSFNAGGFAAQLSLNNQNGSIKVSNCGTLGGTLYVVEAGTVIAGGFISFFESEISNCFSKMNVVVEAVSADQVYAGGFAGYLSRSSSSVSSCYATGDVRASVHTDTFPAFAGGFAGANGYRGEPPTYPGRLYGGTIKDCYALGNVLIDKTGEGLLYAGGFTGSLYGLSGGEIKNCFSTGQISAQSLESNVYAGGIAGRREQDVAINATITNCAALGSKVVAAAGTNTAPKTSSHGRIAGSTQEAGELTGNSANKLMQTGSGDYNGTLDYLYGDISEIMKKYAGATRPTSVDGTKQGMDADVLDLMNAAYWQNTLQFSSTAWDLSTPALYRGYPLLRGVEEQ